MPTELALHLHDRADTLPAGHRLRAIEGVEAVLRLDAGHPVVDVALPRRSRVDQRWALDQLLRRVRALLPHDGVSLSASGDIDDDTLLTLALDLHHATGGRLALAGNDPTQAALREIGGLEDRYRAWVDEDPCKRTSLAIAHDVEQWARTRPDVEITVLDEKELHRLGLRLLLAVGAGSERSPSRLVIASYRAGDGDPLMLLGKGITFDTGGINTKPYESFVSMMKNDMAGAALAWSLFVGLVERRYPRPLLLVIPTCENAVDGKSMHPGDVVRSYRGHTVRIDHTDAEGRLVLADGLAYAADTYQPARVLCFATLTTAALVSYGPYATPVHFADSTWEQRLRRASEATGEDLHFFPERMCHYEANRDAEAALRNTARLPGDASRAAGSRNAAHFLKHFTDRPLIHFDIFASAWNWAGDAPGCGYGATGAPLRTLFRALTD